MKSLLFAILSFAFLLRIIFINEIPPGIANDEINIIINAQSLLKTGQNIPGVVTGIFGQPTGNLAGGIHSEISSYLIIPFLTLGLQWPYVKLPFILASLGIIYISYLLVKKLINKEAALLVAFLAAINPWSIFFARSAYESIFSAFFYLCAIYIVLNLKSWKILWSIPFFLAGFLSYFSAKTLMIPIAFVLLLSVKLMGIKGSFKPTLVVNIFLLIFSLVYFPLLLKTPAGIRFNELKNYHSSETVNLKRTQSIDSPLTFIYENKLTEDLRNRFQAALGILSANFLFINGQPESIPSLTINDHGPLYLIDLPFIVLGLIFLAKHNSNMLFTFLGLISVTLVPNFLNLAGTTYMIRAVILFPLLTIISALGLYHFKNIINKSVSYIYLLLIIVYLIFFGNFIYEYFLRLPIEKNEGWFLQDRIASRYIKLSLETGSHITLVSSNLKQTIYRYLFFNNLYNDFKSVKEINAKLAQKDYSIGKLTVTSSCPDEIEGVLIVDTSLPCSNNLKGLAIASLKDARAVYVITNDNLCQKFTTKRYPLIKDIRDLDIENSSKENLCQKFITNLLLN